MFTSSNKVRQLSFYGLTAITLITFGTYFVLSLPESDPLPILGEVSNFELTDSQGESFNQNQLKGKIWIADFIFTTCAGPCPVMTSQLASLCRSYLLEKDVHFVSVTVNPDYDSPQVLQEYAKKFNADPARWHFLTGTKDSIRKLAVNELKVGTKEDLVFHSTQFVLIDQNLKIRGYYNGTEKGGTKKLFKDIAKLVKERKQ